MINGLITLLTIAIIFGVALFYKKTAEFVLSHGDGFTLGFSVGLAIGLAIITFYIKATRGYWP